MSLLSKSFASLSSHVEGSPPSPLVALREGLVLVDLASRRKASQHDEAQQYL